MKCDIQSYSRLHFQASSSSARCCNDLRNDPAKGLRHWWDKFIESYAWLSHLSACLVCRSPLPLTHLGHTHTTWLTGRKYAPTYTLTHTHTYTHTHIHTHTQTNTHTHTHKHEHTHTHTHKLKHTEIEKLMTEGSTIQARQPTGVFVNRTQGCRAITFSYRCVTNKKASFKVQIVQLRIREWGGKRKKTRRRSRLVMDCQIGKQSPETKCAKCFFSSPLRLPRKGKKRTLTLSDEEKRRKGWKKPFDTVAQSWAFWLFVVLRLRTHQFWLQAKKWNNVYINI